MAHENIAKEFAQYYEQLKKPIFNYLLYRVSFDRDLAEDLTADVFMKAYEHFHTYDRARSFKTWVFTIAHNHLINYLTGRKQTLSLDETIKVEDNEPAISDSYADEIDMQMTMEHLMTVIQSLPDYQRELITMRYVNDFSNSEIASVLGKDEGAVRTALSRAIAAIRNNYIRHRNS